MTSRTISKVALVGAGRVGTAVAHLMKQAGHSIVGVSSRTSASQDRSADRLGCGTFDYRTELPEADIVLLGVGDAALEEVAAALAPRLRANTYVCHFAGSLGLEPLTALRSAGGRTCATHPVQACPDVATAITRLPNSAWGVTCAPEEVPWAEDLVVRDLGGRPVHVAENDRPVWHAGAVMVSNGIAALMSIGESMLDSIGVDAAETVLSPLALGTVRNARDGGGGSQTLTGPVVRGETFIIERHIEALQDPELVAAYGRVVTMIVAAARRSGRIEDSVAREMLDRVRS